MDIKFDSPGVEAFVRDYAEGLHVSYSHFMQCLVIDMMAYIAACDRIGCPVLLMPFTGIVDGGKREMTDYELFQLLVEHHVQEFGGEPVAEPDEDEITAQIERETARRSGLRERDTLRAWAVEQGYCTREESRRLGPSICEQIKRCRAGEVSHEKMKSSINYDLVQKKVRK